MLSRSTHLKAAQKTLMKLTPELDTLFDEETVRKQGADERNCGLTPNMKSRNIDLFKFTTIKKIKSICWFIGVF